MPLVPPIPYDCNLPMHVTQVKLVCDICGHSEKRDVPLNTAELMINWPRHHNEYKSLVWSLKCQQCDKTIQDQRLEKGRAPLVFMPGTYQTRVFIGGNYEHMSRLRDIKSAVFALDAGFFPVLPYDDFLIPRGQIHDWDLRLLHNCNYAIFDVTQPAGELMEIERCAEYKALTLLVYDSRGLAKEPPRVRTMLLESGEHEHRSYGNTPELNEIVKEFLLEKEPQAFRRALGMFGFVCGDHLVKTEIDSAGKAQHEYSYYGLRIAISGFSVTQITHSFRFSSGKIEELYLEPNLRVNWRLDDAVSSDRGRIGIVSFDPPLREGGEYISYTFKARTSGAYAMKRKQLGTIPRDPVTDLWVAAGREFDQRQIAFPIENFSLMLKFPPKYGCVPEPIAYFGAEQRGDGIRIPPDKYVFENDIATLSVCKPKVHYYYGLAWDVPD